MPTIPLEEQLASALRQHLVFSLLEGTALVQLAQALEMVSFSIGETILREGEPGDCAYLIHAGKVRVFKESPAGKPITLASLGAGDLFGEHAILQDEARTASARASEDCVLFRVPRATFAQLLGAQPGLTPHLERLLRQRASGRFLQMGTRLGVVPVRQVLALLNHLEDCAFPPGQIVFREGERGECMYIIRAGEAKVTKGEAGQETVLAYLGTADYFGERALILEEPRYASVVALTELHCFRLGREQFLQLKDSAPQLQEQLTRGLEQYSMAEEMARKFGARPSSGKKAVATGLVDDEKYQEPPASRQPARLSRLLTWLGIRRSFPFLPQEDQSDCGAAALAMIACYHNIPMSVECLRDLAHVGAEGASLLSLTTAAETIGFRWRAINTDNGHLDGLTLPAIAHWKGYHYVVLYKCASNKVVVGDPALGLITMSRNEFAAGWTGGLLLLAPAPDLRPQAAATGWQRLLGLITPYRNALLGLTLVSILVAAIQVSFPLLTQLMVDRVLEHRETGPPLALGGCLLLSGIALGIALRFRLVLVDRLLARMSTQVTADWFQRLLMLPWRYFQSRPAGRVLEHLESCRQVHSPLARFTLLALLDLGLVLVGLGLLLSYNLVMAIIALTPVILFAISLLFNTFSDRSARPSSEFQQARSAWLEAIQAQVTIKDAMADAELSRRHRDLLTLPTASWSGSCALVSWTAAIHALAGVWALWYGASVVLENRLTVGQLVASQCLLFLISIPLLELAAMWPTIAEIRRFMRALADNEALSSEQGLAKPRIVLPRLRGIIRFEEVGYRPRPESSELLAHINLDLQPGHVVWLVGRSGSGKTTLAQLLARLLLPSAGKITVDGFDLATVDLRSLRGQVSLISEEPAVLQGTIRENIALAEPGAPLEDVIRAAKLAGAHDFIMRVPLAYDTVVGPIGLQLSRGQRQALSIARGLLKDPRLLILDEATSALDAETERAFLKNLRWLASDRATLVLSRRPLGVQANDRVIVLEDGEIVDQGTHGELVAQSGLYGYLAGWAK